MASPTLLRSTETRLIIKAHDDHDDHDDPDDHDILMTLTQQLPSEVPSLPPGLLAALLLLELPLGHPDGLGGVEEESHVQPGRGEPHLDLDPGVNMV